jgi:DNA-binding CsgD family transcriptional regulator
MSATKIFSIIVALVSMVLAIKTCSPKTTESSALFFENAEYNGNYFASLPLRSPDSTVMHIKNEVPTPFQSYACESAFYRLPRDMPKTLVYKYLDLVEKTFPYDSVLVYTKGLRGRLFLSENRFDTALVCLMESAALAKKIHSVQRIGDAQFLLGGYYSRQTNYPEAIKRLQDAYDAYTLFPESLTNGQLFEVMMSLGNAYYRAKDYVFAQIWHQKAWDLARTYEWAKGFKILSATAIARNYLSLHQLDSAKTMIDTAFYYQNLYKNNYDEANRYHILGQIQVAQGNCAVGLLNLQKAQQTNLAIEDSAIIHRYNEGLTSAYLCLGRLDSAIHSYQIALATPDKAAQARIYEQLSKIYAQTGNYALAYSAQQNSQRLSDRVFTIERDKEIGRLQAQNELQNRERQVIEAENKNKLTRIYVVVALLALVIGLIAGLFWGYRKKQESRLAHQEKKLAQQEKELAQQEKDLIQQEKELIQQEKELIEARELLKTQALMQAEKDLEIKTEALVQVEQDLVVKEEALKQSNQLLDLKNLMIQALEMQLTVKEENTNPQVPSSSSNRDASTVSDTPLHNLKILTSEDWRKFRQLFDSRFPSFFSNLTSQFPKLTAAEIRLLLLIKIGFDAVEIADILGITTASVYTARYRLRKKLNLSEDGDLEKFIEEIIN